MSVIKLKRFLKGQACPSQFLHRMSSPTQDPLEYPWDQLKIKKHYINLLTEIISNRWVKRIQGQFQILEDHTWYMLPNSKGISTQNLIL